MRKYHPIEQFRNCIKEVQYAFETPPVLQFTGTVKLHGTNGGVELPVNVPQSRNNVVSVENDNCGFAKFHEERKHVFADIYTVLGVELPVVIYGEWAGKGIQRGVGISELERGFYIFGVKVLTGEDTHYWLKDYTLPDTSAHNIFDIRTFKTFDIAIDFSNPGLSQNTLVSLTEEVEHECPVAKHFGVSGVGEGIVWEHVTDKGEMFSFKVKGEKHSASKVKVLAEVDVERLNNITEFVEYAVTENRLQQAVNETGASDVSQMGTFIKWVSSDVAKEENDTLLANGLTMKDIGGPLSKKARTWFLSQLEV